MTNVVDVDVDERVGQPESQRTGRDCENSLSINSKLMLKCSVKLLHKQLTQK